MTPTDDPDDVLYRIAKALERIADRLDSWTSSYEDEYNKGSEIHRLSVRNSK